MTIERRTSNFERKESPLIIAAAIFFVRRSKLDVRHSIDCTTDSGAENQKGPRYDGLGDMRVKRGRVSHDSEPIILIARSF